MRKVLNVAEKPSVAKAIARVLSGGESLETLTTYSKFNQVYSLTRDFGEKEAAVLVTSVTGHIKELYFLPPHDTWGNRDARELLTQAQIVRRPVEDKLDLVRTIQKYAKESTDLFLWLDCDREGEAIAFDVIDLCKEVNPYLSVHRANFSSIEQGEIERAWDHPGLPDINQAKAVNVRQEIDLRSGFAFSQIQTNELRKFYPSSFERVVSYGPCQFPTLFFVVERYLLHTQFVPEPFWSIVAQATKDQSTVNFNWDRNRVFDESECAQYYGAATKDFATKKDIKGTIVEVENKKSVMYKPYALTTVTFQKMAVSKLKITSDQAMGVAEKLYQAGFVSYPRTETNSYPEDFKFKSILKKLGEDGEYTQYVDHLLTDNGFLPPRQGKQSDKAHPPIHPIKAYTGNKSSVEYKVYDLISRTFMANCSRDAITAVSNLKLDVGGELFSASGMTILEPNFLNIYRKFATVNEKNIPKFEKDEVVPLSHFVMKRSETTPPPLLNESDLISLMDKNGVGTDATMHEHIKTIQDRKYAQKVRSNFVPTQLGLSLFAGYRFVLPDLIDPLQRAKTEKSLQEISTGNLESKDFLAGVLSDLENKFDTLVDHRKEFLDHFRETYNKFKDLEGKSLPEKEVDPDRIDAAESNWIHLTDCPKCKTGKLRAIKSKKGFYFIGCSTYKCSTFFFSQKVGNVEVIDKTCNICQGPQMRVTKLDSEVTLEYCTKIDCDATFRKAVVSAAGMQHERSNSKKKESNDPFKPAANRTTIPKPMDGSKKGRGMDKPSDQNGRKERSPNKFLDDDDDDDLDGETVKDGAKYGKGKKVAKGAAATGKRRPGQYKATNYAPKAASKNRPIEDVVCYKCKNPGHYATQCKK